MKPMISEKLLLMEPVLKIKSAEGVIKVLCKRLEELNYIDPSYVNQVIQREKKFPTGLPTVPYCTAIPHGDSIGVKHTGVAVAVLQNPVPFQAMDAPDKTLDVRLVFLMAVANSNNQVAMLQWVGEIVQSQKVLKDLVIAKTPSDGIEIIKPFLYQTISNKEKK
jgi:PTS system galactitol-specific IIA component